MTRMIDLVTWTHISKNKNKKASLDALLVFIAVKRHSNLKQLETGFCVPGPSSVMEAKAGPRRQNLKRNPWKNTAYWLALHGPLSPLSDMTQDRALWLHPPTLHSSLNLEKAYRPAHLGRHFLNCRSPSQITLAWVKLT